MEAVHFVVHIRCQGGLVVGEADMPAASCSEVAAGILTAAAAEDTLIAEEVEQSLIAAAAEDTPTVEVSEDTQIAGLVEDTPTVVGSAVVVAEVEPALVVEVAVVAVQEVALDAKGPEEEPVVVPLDESVVTTLVVLVAKLSKQAAAM